MLRDYIDGKLLSHQENMFVDEIDYLVDDAVNYLVDKQDEHYLPTTEVVLLSRLMYEVGYIKLAKAKEVELELHSHADGVSTIMKYSHFSDGTDIFYNTEDIPIVNSRTPKVVLRSGQHSRIIKKIDGSLYTKIQLDVPYRELGGVKLFKGDVELKYSQAFTDDEADYSLEILYSGMMQVVIRKVNLSVGDDIEVNIFTCIPPVHSKTVGLQHIELPINSISETVAVVSEYEPPMTLEEMSDVILYNKNINNTLVYNENYKDFLLANIPKIKLLKVWHEDKEPSMCAINKVFVSYLSVDGSNLDDLITQAINRAVYGRVVVVRPPLIQKISVKVTIIDNIRRKLPPRTKGNIIKLISRYYLEINKEKVYRIIADELKRHDTDIILKVSQKGLEEPNKFYLVEEDLVELDIVQRF